jgi:uncharacterized membrane protein
MLMTLASMAVDIGRIVDTNRTLQGDADLIALDAARLLDGTTAGELGRKVQLAAQYIASHNNITVQPSQIVLGQYSYDSTGVGHFAAITNLAQVPNAVQIRPSATVPFLFQVGSVSPTRIATAALQLPPPTTWCVPGQPTCRYPCSLANPATLGFSLGSFVLAFNSNNSVAAQALDAILVPAGVPLPAVAGARIAGYQGLATTSVQLGGQQGLVGVDSTLVSADYLLHQSVSLKSLMSAEATVLNNQGQTTAGGTLQQISAVIPATTQVALSGAFKASPLLTAATAASEGYASVLDAEDHITVNGLELLAASARLANGTNAVDLSAIVPGLSAKVAIGSQAVLVPPGFVSDCQGQNVTSGATSQVTVNLALSAALPVGGAVSLPIALGAGYATATLTGLQCVEPPIDTISTFHVVTQALNASAGPLAVAGVPTINLQTSITVGGSDTLLTFTGPYDGSQTKTTSTSSPSLNVSSNLLSQLEALSGLPLATLLPITNALSGSTALLDQYLPQLLPALGIAVAGADLTPINLTCGVPVLVPSS